MSATFFEVIFIEHCDDRACAHFTALIGPPLAFLILRKRSGKESMRLCKRDKSTSSHTWRIAFFIPFSVLNFLLSSLSSRMAQRFDRVNVITFRGPTFHHINPMLLQPTLSGLCCVTRRLVLLQFPRFLFVLKPPLRSRQQLLLQNVLVCVCIESTFIQCQFSFSFGAESSPRIHRQPPPLHLLRRNLTHRFGPNKVMSRVAAFELFERMFITKHHIVPVLLGVGLSELQSTTLVGFWQSRGLRCLNACKSRRCIVLCTVE